MASSGEWLVPIERIAAQIYVIRGESVMLDADLAALYGVTTSALNQQVKRSQRRFPEDSLFSSPARSSTL